jgi:antitoxin VapB
MKQFDEAGVDRLAPRVSNSEGAKLSEEVLAIARRCAALPVSDTRTPEEILGYDRNGLPG